ncbi:NAD(P)-dependent dehydrogenase, short-chain alcohol dehydrogenase family [Friedmanniella luteola]|uniref:NAD(P)-dependent dehydrogenase, short-chain alcohol dehydrogenase family n=1 Tax=Friedmanniella luteola TaxID=546871 RepID=A0A1H1M1D4_9ACTN|nr:SDR family NAD(P)-dependent oxidoreductase [Friedmanniella luteola]SDR80440.1 NAD(P)-dependent dehydrogenase, short-chain alcohol dehydrogenase family [Friedmanniella luteola]
MTTPAASSPVALVTGANKGLGLETVVRLAALGWTVHLGARDPERLDQAVAEVAGRVDGADVRPLPLDVTDDASVAAAVATVRAASGRLDVLVNNAGVAGTHAAPADTVAADFLPVFGVNVLGPVRMTAAFLPLLRAAAAPRVVMVSSGLGSFGVTTDPGRFESQVPSVVYPSAKAALNMITSQYAKFLDGVRVVAVDPGYTATDLNAHSGPQTVTEGTDAVVQACTADDLPGTFFSRSGVEPW